MFKGILDNPLFCSILVVTAVLQVLIVQFGSIAFKVVDGGLNAKYWGISMGLGALSILVQQVINVVTYPVYKNKKRKKKYGHQTSARLVVGVDGE